MAAAKVLVTGGAGYIGSHACKALAQAGYEPVVFDNLSAGHKWAVQWGPMFLGDLRNPEDLKRVFQEFKPEAVMHFAALTSVAESVRDPIFYYETNVLGSLNLLRQTIEAGVRCFVFSSTAAVYGNALEETIREGSPLAPINPYGSSKLMFEQILKDADRSHGIRFTALRYFNAAGCDPMGEIGEAHKPETHLIPIILEVAKGERKELMIFGQDYPTPDGTCIRDYVHVSDLASAHVLALQRLMGGGASESFNLGNSTGFSVCQMVSLVEQITGVKIPVKVAERRPGDPARLVADSSKARQLLDWKPKFSDLEKIVETAWKWKCSFSR